MDAPDLHDCFCRSHLLRRDEEEKREGILRLLAALVTLLAGNKVPVT
jgi:hypothetical protein